MAASVGHPAGIGSLRAARDSELSVNDVLPAAALAICRKLRSALEHQPDRLLQRWLDRGSLVAARPANVRTFKSSGLRFSRHLAVSTTTR